LSKTAILLTEYATVRRKAGMTLSQAAYTAASVRLRPILMTALTMVFGMLPLMFSTGVGANGNSSLGTSVVGGMVIGTLALLFMVPSFFIFFQKMHEHFHSSYKVEEESGLDLETSIELEVERVRIERENEIKNSSKKK
ncbi:MAG: efflux RND transporter permease subunit, partial [Bacteroidaceae bacterium]|nr:efflux RND transporter permease subunit [Bacteroidaceae bacterium]